MTAACDERGHPIDLFRVAGAGVPARRPTRCRAHAALPAPIPKLCTLVVASAFDAAIHDAYGKAFGVSGYETYGARVHDAATCRATSGPEFTGEYLDRYVPRRRSRTMPVFHSVGASDPLEAARRARRGSTTGCPTRSRSGSRATA